jgi:hypothetical protein
MLMVQDGTEERVELALLLKELVKTEVNSLEKFSSQIKDENYPHLKEFVDLIKNRLEEVKVEIKWIPREQNIAGKLL